ncbi:hypothetical protein LJB75_00100 [Bacteroidales bacterium OttesenSCG-928-L19]|nr:hypothetical protein [Bacteroidales bacterium OttesenSCG-928-L19]
MITGSAAGDAQSQLQNKTNLKLDFDKNGKATIVGGKAKTKADRMLKKMINDDKRTVEIKAENSNEFTAHDGNKYKYENNGGGAYGGSTVAADGHTTAYQYVNPQQLANWDAKVGDQQSGGYMLHEVAEGYASSRIAFRKGTGDAVGGSRYDAVHQKANRISGGNWYRTDNYITIPNFSLKPFPHIKLGASQIKITKYSR